MSQLTDNEVLARWMGEKVYIKYHKSWGKIMPVWYKFRDLKIEGIVTENTIADVSRLQRLKGTIRRAILLKGPSPKVAAKHLANAIRWYQTVKQ
jgi:hypothetical protein